MLKSNGGKKKKKVKSKIKMFSLDVKVPASDVIHMDLMQDTWCESSSHS